MKLNRRYAMYVYWFVLVAAIVTRILQLAAVVDYKTGFYIPGGILPPALKVITICGIVIISLIVILGSSRNIKNESVELVNPFLADLDVLSGMLGPIFSISAMTLAFAISLDGVIEYRYLSLRDELTASFTIEFILMLASAVVFLKIAIARLKDKPITKGMGYTLVIPVIWYIFRSTVLFMSFSQITNISENLLSILSSLSTLLFLVNFARFFAGFEKNNTRPMLIISGLICSIFCTVSTVPRFILMVIGTVEMRQAMGSPSISDLTFAVMAASIAGLLLAKSKPVTVHAQSSDADDANG